MTRAALALLAAVLVAAVAGTARADTFSVVSVPEGLPSYEIPNGPGDIVVPLALSRPPQAPETRSHDQLLALWRSAGVAYGVPWQVLAAINKIESNFGRNMGPSSAGALGWMQFIPSSWMRWGMDASGDGIASPWNPEDGVYSAARYLAAAGAHEDIERAIFAYNHAQWYVDDVLELAAAFGGEGSAFALGGPTGPNTVFAADEIEEQLRGARRAVARAKRGVDELERRLERLDWALLEAQQQAGDPTLSTKEFHRLERRVTRVALAQERVHVQLEERYQKLDYAVSRVAELRKQAALPALGQGPAALSGAPLSEGDYVFPVGGGPKTVSVAHTHHDYPAADIAAPEGAPIFAHADAVVVAAWPSPNGRCGIGLQLRTDDGEWVYCHFAYLEPGVEDGVAVAAGTQLGLVGSTGRSTGPHLHLQRAPAKSYPQEEPWFQGFAGRAYRWQDAPTPPMDSVFTVVAEPVITFSG